MTLGENYRGFHISPALIDSFPPFLTFSLFSHVSFYCIIIIISYPSLAFFSATVSLLIPERKLSKLAGSTRVAIVLDAATQHPSPKNLVVFGFPPKHTCSLGWSHQRTFAGVACFLLTCLCLAWPGTILGGISLVTWTSELAKAPIRPSTFSG